nr:B12-binding domain-containing radical SAM protein [Nitrospirota bacterium]
MAKVLMVNPIVRAEDDPHHVPYGLALLAGVAVREGHQIQVFDANAWRPDDSELVDALKADQWDVIATGGITTTYGYMKKTVRLAREHAPHALIMMGGGALTAMPRDIMGFCPQIDIGGVGEGVVTFPEVLEKIDEGRTRASDWSDVPGIIWRDAQGEVRLNAERPLLANLDSLPFPAYELFPLDIYFKNSCILLSEEAMTAKRRLDINMSYGCSLICRFCFHLGLTGDMKYTDQDQADGGDVVFNNDRNIRWHSPDFVVRQVKYMKERFKVDFVAFLDENLMTMHVTTKKKWLFEICDLWIKEGLQPSCVRDGVPHDPNVCEGVHWGGTSHATLAYPEVLQAMHKAGCSYLDYGLESFSDRVLKTIGKGATVKTNERCLKITMEAGIRPIPNQIIGFPDEFFDSLYDDMAFWDRIGLMVKPFFATPYPGSEWYYTHKDRILAQYGGDLEAFILDLGDATKITAVISHNFNAVELLGLREMMLLRDVKRIKEYEALWRSIHGEPKFSKDLLPQKSVAAEPVSLIQVGHPVAVG